MVSKLLRIGDHAVIGGTTLVEQDVDLCQVCGSTGLISAYNAFVVGELQKILDKKPLNRFAEAYFQELKHNANLHT